MTDWTTIPNDVIEAGKPGRAVDGRALRDNPVAIAEGAPGAPGISSVAFIDPIEVRSFSRDNTQVITGLEGVKLLEVDGAFNITSGGRFYLYTSDDGGSTWPNRTEPFFFAVGDHRSRMLLDFEAGKLYLIGTVFPQTGDPKTESRDISLSLPAGPVNAIRIIMENTTGQMFITKLCGYKAA
ncbi:hypothetical protein [Rhodovulum sulfidophilum]|uniref:hypothetical protein n=1 Tax=Rhodovulum sulfidophilum TaxID=35806 RepID=UPI0009530347|nr:hypothetical protein [Rhodovulum sulfidophilum]MBL3552716.1 hypothetical protein [Rhodovulum sulfidophilum]OLS47570.1 hypothetical protein BV379_04225 [Rhodovulum sulfidophilum]